MQKLASYPLLHISFNRSRQSPHQVELTMKRRQNKKSTPPAEEKTEVAEEET
jgi:hypothetical protein